MRKEPTGYAVIEFNHSGIPDNELKPEEFTPRQEAVLRALQKDRQAQIRRGCPVAVIDMATGDRIESFNMKNVAPSEFQKTNLAEPCTRQFIGLCRIRRMQRSSRNGRSNVRGTAPHRKNES